MTTIVWFGNDLRLDDHAALHYAATAAVRVLPVYVWNDPPIGGASRWWLHESLRALDASLQRQGSRLLLLKGDPTVLLPELALATGATTICWNEPSAPDPERHRTAEALGAAGIETVVFPSDLLHDPGKFRTRDGGPYRVFTPFWRKFAAEITVSTPLPRPSLPPLPLAVPSYPVSIPSPPLSQLGAHWRPGEAGARERLQAFVSEGVSRYATDRDRPDRDGTSLLSPHLHFGEITPRQVWHAVLEKAPWPEAEPFLRQIAWREFAHHLLVHYPWMTDRPLDPRFEGFRQRLDETEIECWQRGETGYPIVDAGMRQLRATGWMHNRVRMIAASFLTKHLLVPWQIGAAWFADALVDADPANNAMGWQWVAGCGADAQPFFRIFNPVAQGERFDPEGRYVRTWVPELAHVPARYIHKPWTNPFAPLAVPSPRTGRQYVSPMVDHARARERALEAYHEIRER